jgi:hypothetical protein
MGALPFEKLALNFILPLVNALAERQEIRRSKGSQFFRPSGCFPKDFCAGSA